MLAFKRVSYICKKLGELLLNIVASPAYLVYIICKKYEEILIEPCRNFAQDSEDEDAFYHFIWFLVFLFSTTFLAFILAFKIDNVALRSALIYFFGILAAAGSVMTILVYPVKRADL